MSDNPEGMGNSAAQPQETITIHKRVRDVTGSGKIDKATGRYIPISGGSRSRIPMADDKRISRYAGNLGVDASLSGKIDSMAALYSRLSSTTKQGLGADFPQSIGRPELADLPPVEGSAEVDPAEGMTDVPPVDAAPESAPPEEAPQPPLEKDPPALEADEPAPKRKILPDARDWDHMII